MGLTQKQMLSISWWVSYILLTLAGAFLFSAWVFGRVEVDQPAWWERPPVVLVCSTAPDWVTFPVVESALARWRDLGYAVGDPIFGECAEGLVPGVIKVDQFNAGTGLSSALEGHVGQCVRVKEGEIKAAAIQLPAVFPRKSAMRADLPQLVVAHELGHCLGMAHAKAKFGWVSSHPSGHLMHPILVDIGEGTEGIPRGRVEEGGSP